MSSFIGNDNIFFFWDGRLLVHGLAGFTLCTVEEFHANLINDEHDRVDKFIADRLYLFLLVSIRSRVNRGHLHIPLDVDVH